MVWGTFMCPFFMIKHDKCASFEAEIDRLKKENDEMKVILIFLLLAWPNPDKKEQEKHYNFEKTLKAFE